MESKIVHLLTAMESSDMESSDMELMEALNRAYDTIFRNPKLGSALSLTKQDINTDSYFVDDPHLKQPDPKVSKLAHKSQLGFGRQSVRMIPGRMDVTNEPRSDYKSSQNANGSTGGWAGSSGGYSLGGPVG